MLSKLQCCRVQVCFSSIFRHFSSVSHLDKTKFDFNFKDEMAVKKFLMVLSEKLNLQNEKDWNSITRKKIRDNGGEEFLQLYSLYELKCIGFPDGKSKFLTKRKQKPANYWENNENVQGFLNHLKEKLKLTTINDWNSLTQKDIKNFGGASLLKLYSMYDLKSLGFPDGKLKYLHEGKQKPANYWENKENIKRFLNNLQDKLNLKTSKDWNSITNKIIHKYGGGGLLKSYSLYELKCLGFPDGKSDFYQPHNPPGFWNNKENIQDILNHLKVNLNLNTPEKWNSLSSTKIKQNGAGKLLSSFNMYQIKCMGCPEGKEIFTKPNKSVGFWKNKENVQKFIDNLRETLNLKTFDDWNSITQKEIQFFGGGSILGLHSMYELKCLGFPEGKSEFPRIIERKVPGYWDKQENILNFIDKIKERYQINNNEDWNRISSSQIGTSGGWGLLSRYSKKDIIQNSFPEIQESSGYRSSQRWLFLQIQKIFPGEEIIEDYFHSDVSRKTGFPVQFDIFLIRHDIAFEYHGKQHYEEISSLAPIEMYQNRDKEKLSLCKKFGIKLIIVPYTWDNSLETLQQIIEKQVDITIIINK